MTRHRFLLALVLCAATAPHALAKRTAQCTISSDGPTSITEVTAHARAGGSRLTLTVTTKTLLGGAASYVVTAVFGKKQAFASTIAYSGTDIHVTSEFGVGFKGLRHTELDSTDGTHFTGQFDGRAVTISGDGTNAQSVVFADGLAPPTLKVKGKVKQALAKARKAVQGASCPNTSTAPKPQAIFDDCDRCKLGCNLDPTKAGSLLCAVNIMSSAVSCAASPVITPVLCVVLFELNGLSCTTNAINCEKACLASDACCKVHCPGAVGLCCNGDGEVCCGKDGPNGGSCCTNCCGNPNEMAGAVCCGRGLISGEERNCIDPNIGLCCEADGTVCGGNDCCPPGWTCCDGGYCAPPGQECCSDPATPSSTKNFFCGQGQHCVDRKTNLCCASDAGPECGSGTTCCGGSQLCGSNQQCCTILDLCGTTCCPAPQKCIGGAECCEDAAHVCGGHCCSGFQQCCNGQCCSGICVNGSTCCASINQVCGDVCCPAGTACVDPAHGQCQQCPGGIGEGCPANSGDPVCCPTASQCCSGQCCADGELCCGPPGETPTCQPSFQCIH